MQKSADTSCHTGMFMDRWNRWVLVASFVAYIIIVSGCGTVAPPSTVVRPIPKPVVERKWAPRKLKLPRVKVVPNKWKYIVVHHSATPSGSAASFDKFHRNKRGWDRGLGYHFVIGNGHGSRNGLVETGHRWTGQIDGAHAGSAEYNQHGIGVCLVGDFEAGSPTKDQMESLAELVAELQGLCDIPSENVILHRHMRDTQCPGSGFPYYELLVNLPR